MKDTYKAMHADSFTAEQEEQVRHALHDLLLSTPFRATLQCQHLMQYIVDHTLAGEDALLRERVIGNEVFGRKPDYEPGEDPVVRIRAADLRKRLAVYYQSFPGTPQVRFDVPSGSYKATFAWKQELAAGVPAHGSTVVEPKPRSPFSEPTPEPSPEASLLPPSLPQAPAVVSTLPHLVLSRKIILWSMAGLLALLAVLAGTNWYRGRADRALRAFWAPLLDSPRPVLVSIGSNAVYRVSDEKSDEYGKQHQLEGSGMEFFPEFAPGQSFASTGLYATPDSFVALGDVSAVARTVATLGHFSKTYQERFPNDISFAEVHSNPSILIGGFNNPMTRELTRNYRFALTTRNRIEDHASPGKAWVLHASNDSHDTEDYAIITRVLHQKNDAPLVSVAGMGQYGTLAATEFICDPDTLNQLNASLGRGWQQQNFQLVLRIKIVDFKPVSTYIIATNTW